MQLSRFKAKSFDGKVGVGKSYDGHVVKWIPVSNFVDNCGKWRR